LTRVVPNSKNLERAQAELNGQGCGVDLVDSLRSPDTV
jgi:hypothetical protein